MRSIIASMGNDKEVRVPNLVSSLDISQRVSSAFNGGDHNRRVRPHKCHHGGSDSHTRNALSGKVLGSGKEMPLDVQ